ncbi:transposase [Streptomyces mirabilis]
MKAGPPAQFGIAEVLQHDGRGVVRLTRRGAGPALVEGPRRATRGLRLLRPPTGGGSTRRAARPAARLGEDAGRDPEPSAVIDTRSLRAPPTIPRSTSGWDGGKEVGGRKQYVMVDCLGLLLVVMVTAASVQDRDAAGPVPARLRARFRKIQLVWAGGGYVGRLVIWAAEKLQLTFEIVKRSDDASGFVVLRDVGSWRGR